VDDYPAGDVAIMPRPAARSPHAPWVFARRERPHGSFALYARRASNVAPHRHQSAVGHRGHALGRRLPPDRRAQHRATTAADAFDAATLGGARALGRDDLGRSPAGATADLVLWKASSWA